MPVSSDATGDSSNAAGTSAEQDGSLPQPTEYRYVWVKIPFLWGRYITISRYSVDLGLRLGTLLFTLIYSSALYLLVTAPEEIAIGLETLMTPLRWFKFPVTEVALTLTLSLRFIPLVLEEVQNLVRSIQTRAINWQKLGFRGSVQVWFAVADRLLENLLNRADQVASSMLVRGFTSPNRHRVQWHYLQLRVLDWVAIAGLVAFWSARLLWGWEA
ncbi:MAG: energy-coupling factor transporter transmembrane protein EcfT [Coleofasciculaceae cyanobacterium SM2_3_26]|nr:energy-coupling factor transporter transmembrane protein EcfT [Coleofasciculaceae cyanobacterium SM2_3_26]